MRKRFLLLLMLLSISILLHAQDDESLIPDMRDEFAAGDFVYELCPFYILPPEVEEETVDCGYLFVPENRSDSNSPLIQLTVMIIYATGSAPYDEPIIYLEGGPGGSAIAGYEHWYSSALREDYNIILIDQRGTGFSLPSLNCYEADESEVYVEDCAQRLRAEGIDLAAYNSAENAHDIADLIEALELDAVNLYGTSYGTRLALTVMRDHPENLRSVILEAVYPPNAQGYEDQALNFWIALENLFSACEEDDFCADEYPDLEDTFFEAIETLNDSSMEYEDYLTGDIYDMDGYTFADDIFQKMYDSTWLPYIPALIYAAADGDGASYSEIGYEDLPEEADYSDEYYAALDEAFMDYLGFEDYDEMYDYIDSLDDEEYYAIEEAILGYIDDDSEGMYTSVECVEEVHFNSMDAYDEVSEDVPNFLVEYTAISIDASFADCEIWNVSEASDLENELVESAIPTLIISGALDPITPARWGDLAESGLRNSFHYVYPAIGHGGIDTDECPTDMALEFLENPDSAPDDSCIEDMAIEFE